MLWKSTVALQISALGGRVMGYYAVNYGVTDALAPFPLHSLVNAMSATINNNTVSFNVQETLPLLLRMVDPEELAKYDCMTPTTLDFLANYDDNVTTMDWQIDTPILAVKPGTNQHPKVYEAGDDDDERSATANPARVAGRRAVGYHSYANNVLSYDMNRPAGTAYYH
ncbi:MAG: phage major capsid domain-containing protein, partial [Candidatus Fonsibacter sp.]